MMLKMVLHSPSSLAATFGGTGLNCGVSDAHSVATHSHYKLFLERINQIKLKELLIAVAAVALNYIALFKKQ